MIVLAAGAFAGLLAGLIAGSFLAALTIRWPAGRSIAAGRSRCDTCDTALAPYDLVPVLSHLALGGRCRQCGAVIPRRHLWIELAAGAIGALALGLYPDEVGATGAIFGWALLALAVLDVEHFWLPDRLTLPLLGIGLLAGVWLEPTLADRAIGVAAGFASLAAIAWVYKVMTGRTGMGGGDPKLFAAIGAWLGWQALPFVLVAAASLGLIIAALAAARGADIGRRTRMPLGSLLAAAAFPVWLLLPLLAMVRS